MRQKLVSTARQHACDDPDLVPALVHHLKVSADVLLVSLGRDAGGDDASTAGVDVQQVVVTCRDLGLAVLWQNTGVVSIIT